MGEKTVTVSVRGILLTAVILLGLLTAYLLGSAGGGGGPAQAAAPTASGTDTPRRVLTMSGTGEGTTVPDQLSFDLAVGLERTDLDTALSDASGVMNRVLNQLEGLGIRRGDMQTTGLSMSPVYDYHQYSPPTIRGYQVTQRASVLVEQLKDGGGAVSTAVDTGGNAVRVSNIRLRVGDPDAAMKKARDAAVAEARAKAEQYAAAAGQQLGDVITLREVSAPRRSDLVKGYAVQSLRGAMDSAAVPVPIRTGKDTMKVTVRVVWALG